MHVFGAEQSGSEVDERVTSAVAALGWEDELQEGVDEMRRWFLTKDGCCERG
jgi:hypothetical protein